MFINHNWKNLHLYFVLHGQPAKAGSVRQYKPSINKYQMSFKLSGKKIIKYKQKKLDFCAGDILFIPTEKDININYEHITVEEGESISIYFSSSEPLFDEIEKIAVNDPKIENLFVRLDRTFNDIEQSPFISMQLFYELLYSVQQFIISQDKSNNYNKVIAYIHEHLSDPYINIEELANTCNMTKEYFRHAFKKEFGVPPLQYINNLKTTQIKSLLYKKMSMSKIAQITGFSTTNYLSRFFKKQTGLTPSEYKKLYFD